MYHCLFRFELTVKIEMYHTSIGLEGLKKGGSHFGDGLTILSSHYTAPFD